MEEKNFAKNEDISGLLDQNIERIAPDFPLHEKRRISIYLLLTLSAAVFVIGFVFADFGFKLLKNRAEDLPSVLLTEIFGGETDDLGLTLSEFISGKILGISKFRAEKLTYANAEPGTDEHEKMDLKDPVSEETKDSADTLYTESDAVGSHAGETMPQKEDDEAVKYPIVALDLSQNSMGEYYIGNETGYNPNIKALLEKKDIVPDFSEPENKNSPLVLIIHTHGTEAYAEEGIDYYVDDGGEISRTQDTEKNIVAIGKLMAEILNEEGINTVHCDIMHDKESYQDSYIRAAESIKSYIAKYPTIKYVFDVHRDAILKADGSLVKAVTEIDGESVAQVMTVVGSNYKGANFPDWENHLALALRLKSKLGESYEKLSRPVYLRGAAYNQQYTEGSLLLEIGSSGNTLNEAKRAAELVAYALADIIKEG